MVAVTENLVQFRFYRPRAGSVFLVGDFNHWRSGQIPMIKGMDGYWTAQVHLPAGTYRFRYFCDGEWFTDYAAFGVEQGPFGLDSIIRVPQAA